ncbi:MAG: HAMP domain-containing protein [Phycisphaerae bacterium]|nr:HAMP domain-containing protein [Phycisphaerae bacterium]
MRTLFLKIFLWFWPAMILVVGIFVALDFWQRRLNPPPRGGLHDTIQLCGQEALEAWERGGVTELDAFCARLSEVTSMCAVLLDEQRRALSTAPVPDGATDIAARLDADRPEALQRTPGGPLIAVRVIGRTGAPHVFVAHVTRGPWNEARLDWTTLSWQLAAVIAVSGVLCYGLARYLSAPVRRLRTAARRLASGDLTARAGSATSRRRDEIADLARDFDYMAERVETLVASQQRLLRDISHELRSPLARVCVALGLARRAAGDAATPALDRIERDAERLNELIGQLLTLTRLANNAEQPEQVPLALAELVELVVADARFEAGAAHRQVVFTASADCTVLGSPELLRRAIENVVRNAVRYTLEGTTVTVTLDQVSEGGAHRAQLEVRDRGPGVPASALQDIFRPFYRVADARDRHSGGTGLGLAITAQAVRLHGGRISAENAPDGGLIVRIELPAAPGSPASA